MCNYTEGTVVDYLCLGDNKQNKNISGQNNQILVNHQMWLKYTLKTHDIARQSLLNKSVHFVGAILVLTCFTQLVFQSKSEEQNNNKIRG